VQEVEKGTREREQDTYYVGFEGVSNAFIARGTMKPNNLPA
jgi:hypothetical protein